MERTRSSFCVSQESNKLCDGRTTEHIMKSYEEGVATVLLRRSIHCISSSSRDLSMGVGGSREPPGGHSIEEFSRGTGGIKFNVFPDVLNN